MSHILGLGGIFLRCKNIEETRRFYQETLEIALEPWGAQFFFRNDDVKEGYTNLSFFKNDSAYLAPSEQPFMINLRVRDLEGLLVKLRAKNVQLVGEPVFGEYGKFAWVMDPEGNKIELWEQ